MGIAGWAVPATEGPQERGKTSHASLPRPSSTGDGAGFRGGADRPEQVTGDSYVGLPVIAPATTHAIGG